MRGDRKDEKISNGGGSLWGSRGAGKLPIQLEERKTETNALMIVQETLQCENRQDQMEIENHAR